MATSPREIVNLEQKFWQAMVDEDADTATHLLSEPALMVSSHGSMKFDHEGYRKMAEQGSMLLTSFELNDTEVVFPNEKTAIVMYRVKQTMSPRAGGKNTVQEMNDTSLWIKSGKDWKCAMHTETPAAASGA